MNDILYVGEKAMNIKKAKKFAQANVVLLIMFTILGISLSANLMTHNVTQTDDVTVEPTLFYDNVVAEDLDVQSSIGLVAGTFNSSNISTLSNQCTSNATVMISIESDDIIQGINASVLYKNSVGDWDTIAYVNGSDSYSGYHTIEPNDSIDIQRLYVADSMLMSGTYSFNTTIRKVN